ncbi:MAG: hypothetical protein ACXVJD_02715 [Mucilaginibacter sp.]
MKRNLVLTLSATLILGACRKENIAHNIPAITQVPAQETSQPVNGTTETNNSIVYTRVDQELSYNKFITIDADNNGKNDFYFTSVLIFHDNQSHLYLLASPVSASGAKLLLDNSGELVMNGMWGKPLDADTPIGNSQQSNTIWSNFMIKGVTLEIVDNGQQGYSLSGPWVGKADKYLGMQILINGELHFGWIHLTHTVNEARMRIAGFAYSEISGESIKAGQTH